MMGYRKGDTVRIVGTDLWPDAGAKVDQIRGLVGTVSLTLGIGLSGEHDCFYVDVPGAPNESPSGITGWPLVSEEVELVNAADR